MNLREVKRVTYGKIISGDKTNREVGKICFDSRIIDDGDIFVALKGERTDGNKYIESVIDKASLIVTDKYIKSKSNTPILKVLSTRRAITNIGKYNRKKYINIPLIGITCSIGKTSIKDLIAHIFETKYNVLKTVGSQNNELGVPLTLSKINDKHEIIIMEMGMDHLKELETYSKLTRPNTAIITNIGTSHIGKLKSQDNIFKAKMEIVKYLKNGYLIVNGNDPYLSKVKNDKNYKVIKTNNKKVSNIKVDDKLNFDVLINNKKYKIKFIIPSEPFINSILIAIEVGLLYKIEPSIIVKAINSFTGSTGRVEKKELSNNITIISDCYNASIESIKSSLSLLENTNKKKMAIIGDVLELGKYKNKIHKEIGEALEKIKDLDVITIGEATKIINIGKHFNNNEEAKKYLNKIKLNDTKILIKGSHGMHLEEIEKYIIDKYK